MTSHDDTDRATRLERMLRCHDWHYEMSDAHHVYTAGAAREKIIHDLCKEVGPDVARPLWEKYAPKNHPCPV